MCGIAGFLGSFDLTLVEAMSGVIAHRGPDGSGSLCLPEEGVGLAHRRLAIIDLSNAGAQPMWDVDRRAVIVFNGEIYNYRELRRDLENSGFGFRSQTDTEVLLNLYLREGEKMLSRLNGIFAFAIWDTKRKALFLARDGLGVKPLYYAKTEKGFLFASELKALLLERSVDRSLDRRALSAYLQFLWCPSPLTILKNVRKLLPGHSMWVRDGHIEKMSCFYDIPFGQPEANWSEAEAADMVEEAVDKAVQRQMVADVPVGAFLSGGLDSSAVVALARKYSPGQRMQCFTIDFSGRGSREEGMTADLPYARRLASHLNVDLHTVSVGPDMIGSLERVIYHLDEPQPDPACINLLYIAELARSKGIKVLLSGAGGDDIFSGYRRHRALLLERYWSWLPRLARRGLKMMANGLPVHFPSVRRVAKAFQYADREGDSRLESYFYWTEPETLKRICGVRPDTQWGMDRDSSAEGLLAAGLQDLSPGGSPLNRMLYLDTRYFLADHNLNYTDKLSMAAGVEVRVPLLDPDLLQLAGRMPSRYKQKGSCGKWILKKAMERHLPLDVIYRPKTGFGVPLRYWLRNDLKSMINDSLSEETLSRRGLFDGGEVRRLIQRDARGEIDAAYTIFGLICVELWCKIFLDGIGVVR